MIAVELEVSGLSHTGTRYRVLHNGEVIVKSSRDPEHSAARELLKRGFTGPFQTTYDGAASMTFPSIEETAKWSMQERPDAGLARERYQEHPK